jgi:hypothetical protein
MWNQDSPVSVVSYSIVFYNLFLILSLFSLMYSIKRKPMDMQKVKTNINASNYALKGLSEKVRFA